MKLLKLTPLRLALLLMITGLLVTFAGFQQQVPYRDIAKALIHPDPVIFGEIYLHYALLPRVFVALLAGAALGLAGAIFQQVLRNPLAEPATLGLLSGAQLAIIIGTLLFPAISTFQRELAGIVGAFAALACVAALAVRRDFSPTTLLLTGMVVSFVASALSVILALLNHDYLRAVFIWASGSMLQNDFSTAIALFWRVLFFVPLLMFLVRPLTVAGLDDRAARSLGLPINAVRMLALCLATALCALVVARLGVIAFIGLAAPHVARLSGVRTFKGRMLFAPIFGGLLLVLADALVVVASRFIAEVPTGTVTALCGALLLLMLLRKLPASPLPPTDAIALRQGIAFHPYATILTAIILMLMVTTFSLFEDFFVQAISWHDLLAARWPRIVAAGCAGALLAIAGAMMQSMTGNVLASPEGLGVSAGAGLGVVAAFMLAGADPLAAFAGGSMGALLAFILITAISRADRHGPGSLLLAGIAMGTFASALIAMIIASGDPRAALILVWSMGPTFRANAVMAGSAAAILVLALLILPLFARWLRLLPLGDHCARSLGLAPAFSRPLLLLYSAVLTGAATLVVGPLSFVGLMAPHIAATIIPRQCLSRIVCAAAIGAILMIFADWLGRIVNFPYEIPAGVLAAFMGGPYFLWRLAR
ncbi:Fe(3+)-hydroxamate ABC transporter permease FhuB [Brucella pseudogrignonensis]|uniref:Fe(3+)-hydroxamate ABC transporter permease FhuB n=1 Tax=Brucella pseudogrignonensis TaxID=419475 RepID=UPI00190B12C5|nr:Fe(3+)-hydroxamate ABC transporter permease FhuB [Brucella pseudogrignonensis]MBK0022483.1 Fe(3+)-hydroxamate ABC transporter permease FhuB [Ochrobactrum sp. S45]MBK0044498.1 Fe(3+)-hydroxamate ABC transporter permease FhuB [Ochrobactrum sp. S46]UKK95433.1 Fe(3+)-hydroxamate ABC transporter permease FhuB [Brucella pseudogrignonensis]